LHQPPLCALHWIEAIQLAGCHWRRRQATPEIVGPGGRFDELHDQLAPSPIAAGMTAMRMETGHSMAEALDCGAQA
jgi:hypothetical protein